MQTTINIYMQSNTKFRPNIESLGFKKKRPLNSWERTGWLDDLQLYILDVESRDAEHLKSILVEMRSSLEEMFYLSNLPVVGKRCVGLLRIDEFDDEFDRYLHV